MNPGVTACSRHAPAGPGCRTPYDSEFQVNLVQRKEEAAHSHAPAAAPVASVAALMASPRHHPAPATSAAAPAAPGGGGAGHAVPASPGRNLHIDEEQFWPSLSSAAQSAKGSTAPPTTAATSRHTSPRDTPSPPPVATRSAAAGPAWAGPGGRAGGACPQQQQQQQQELGQQSGGGAGSAERDREGLQHEGSSSCSSATTATTPQSPASSVVAYRVRGGPSVLVEPLLQGTCHVSLAPSALAPPPVDEEGAALALSLQEAVKAGSISVKQAAASLVSYLRQKQQQQAAAAAAAATAGSQAGVPLGHSPLMSLQQLSLGGAAGIGAGVVGGGGGLAADAGRLSLLGICGPLLLGPQPLLASPRRSEPLESSPSLAVSEAPTFAHWGRSDSIMPALSPMSSMHMPGAGLFEGWASPRVSQQQQHPYQQQPLPPGRLPLYLRGAASSLAAVPPASPAHSVNSQPTGLSSFPGFQPAQQVATSVQCQPAPGITCPPGFSRSMYQQRQQQQQQQVAL